MRSCPICKEKINIFSFLCKDCKKIKSFIRIYNKKTLIEFIENYSKNKIDYTFKKPLEMYPTAPAINAYNTNI